MENIDFELLLKILAGLVGAIGLFLQIRNLRNASRSSIKTDLEILEKLTPSDPNYAIVRNSLDQSIKRVYGDPARRKFIPSPVDFWFGFIWCIGFGYWTIYLFRDGFSWWAVVTGLFALGGFGGIITGLEGKKNSQQKRPG
jgi:hypothetical protein